MTRIITLTQSQEEPDGLPPCFRLNNVLRSSDINGDNRTSMSYYFFVLHGLVLRLEPLTTHGGIWTLPCTRTRTQTHTQTPMHTHARMHARMHTRMHARTYVRTLTRSLAHGHDTFHNPTLTGPDQSIHTKELPQRLRKHDDIRGKSRRYGYR